MTIKALIFDLDGTLYRQFPVRCAMAWQLARRYWPRPAAGWRTARALRAYRHAQERLRRRGGDDGRPSKQLDEAAVLSGERADVIRDAVVAWMEEAPLSVLPRHVRPGIDDVLRRARARGLRLGLFSDYPARDKLRVLGLGDAFDVIVTAQDADVERFKPDPRGLLVTLQRLGVGPADAIYVGDRPEVDGEAAARAGVGCVILSSGRRRRPGPWRCTSRVEDLQLLFEP
jgi:HAD superfamily hydrolase (TIGR01549 family)